MLLKTFSIILFVAMLSVGNLSGQHDIRIELENYSNDTLIAGYYYGARQLVFDTLYRNNGRFEIKGKDTLETGIYLFLTFPDNNYFQFLVPKDDQEFTIKLDINNPMPMEADGSMENTVFFDYLTFISERKERVLQINDELSAEDVDEADQARLSIEMESLDVEVKAYNEKLVRERTDALVSKIVKSGFETPLPEFEGTDEEQQVQRYLFYKKHYFDHVDLGDEVLLRTPFLNQRINYYIDKLTPSHPDSMIVTVDYLLSEFEHAPMSFRFYLSEFVNRFTRNKIVGMDAVFVHLVDKYVKSGRADWIDDKNKFKIISKSDGRKRVLIGKTPKNVLLFKENGDSIRIHDIEADYIVLIFWAPECGHCKKIMPKVIEFDKNFKDRGVKVVGICTKHQDKYASCWEAVKEKGMDGFYLNLGDQYHKSRFKMFYNVEQTPKIFILDKDKKIILKDIGGEQLEMVMEEIMKEEKKKGGQN